MAHGDGELPGVRAATEGVGNIEFTAGDVLALPFVDQRVDVVWSRHLLQWVGRREQALREFVRVTRPGGRVVAANFDGFLLQHHPQDAQVQADMERWFGAACVQMGFDNWIGRKLPVLFRDAGLVDITVDTIPDRAFSGLGGDPERLWNMRVQWAAAMDFSSRVFGSREAAEEVHRRFEARFDDPGTYFHCAMFYVQGRVPG